MENRSAPPKKTLWQRLKNMGPAAIVSAALIGPGTVTTSGLTGCNFGFALVWAVLFSVIAMVITQRMTGKIGLHTGIGLAAAIRKVYHGKAVYWPLAVLLILSFFVSNCAYQASNIVGAASGAAVLFGDHRALYCIIISAAALALVLSGSIKYISNVLTVVVFLMVVLLPGNGHCRKARRGRDPEGYVHPLHPQRRADDGHRAHRYDHDALLSLSPL